MEIRVIDAKVLWKGMKKWSGGALVAFLFVLLVLRYGVMNKSIWDSPLSSPLTFNTSHAPKLQQTGAPPVVESPRVSSQVVSADIIISTLFAQRNFSERAQRPLQTWNFMKNILDYTQGLPDAVMAIKEAVYAWGSLSEFIEKEDNIDANENLLRRAKEKQCPYFLNKMNATEFGEGGYSLRIPCGLVEGSSITILAIPNGLLGNFQVDLKGEHLPGEPNPPLILHYNVRLGGDKTTEDPVIVQNTWTIASGWGEEERCPSGVPGNEKKVDGLNQCNQMKEKDGTKKFSGYSKFSLWSSEEQNKYKPRQHFPFKLGYLSVMTLRTGEEGIQMTVDGKHTTSFAFRERLEPWLVNDVRISGDLELIAVLASGLPTSEELSDNADVEALRSVPLASHTPLELFIGVFSTANNFKRRMSIRKTWMQYDAVKSGAVAVRFFVGLHKNQMVNEELWDEIRTYGDIQLMPFIDYYSLITWKTLAICTFATQVVSAKYVMKTDDDSFVRVDEVMTSLKRDNVTNGLLYGLINSDARPHRNHDSKWYISTEEWQEENYPPWAHGPGYVVSHDIANAVYKRNKSGRLKMFKLEDVAMGIWISEMKKEGMQVHYTNEQGVHIEGCKDGYVVSHYQSPREMLCLWQKLQEGKGPKCCGEP